jgi:hypothetical protein
LGRAASHDKNQKLLPPRAFFGIAIGVMWNFLPSGYHLRFFSSFLYWVDCTSPHHSGFDGFALRLHDRRSVAEEGEVGMQSIWYE